MTRSTYGSGGIARYRHAQLERIFGADHPATRAALGRWLAHRGWVPQRGLETPEAIAWHRETGADFGHRNRSHRRRVRTVTP